MHLKLTQTVLDPPDWPDSKSALEFARTWQRHLREVGGVSAPPQLRGTTGAERKRLEEELVSAGIPGAKPNDRVSGGRVWLVFFELCRWYGIDGPFAWRSMEHLAADLGMSERTVRRAVARLNELDLIASRRWKKSTTGGSLAFRHYIPGLDDSAIPPADTVVIARPAPPDARGARWVPVDNHDAGAHGRPDAVSGQVPDAVSGQVPDAVSGQVPDAVSGEY
ncbi:helix-turn-helix domain-containing protein [Agromyces larvae]|uniref:Helix-turn-helix domain-containing protein n=1 Tax=Agromyces larvae TaxID=2929802 RepID=A0ABY4C1D3_9MICO|nr:helix-turn-helix domain-containing protein [Agromyces larvae]UOE45282.1 helix-turn-helix domain-containing protein [Agromyces larvae]